MVKAFRDYQTETQTDILNEYQYDQTEDDETAVALPSHMRCCSHTINLIATTDANKAVNVDKNYNKIHNQAMAKASALWTLTNRSTKAADMAFDILGYRLRVPFVTRWNSHFDSINKISQGLDDNNNFIINKACQKLNLPIFQQTDIAFLKEYVAVMKPLTFSLDLLLGETRSCLDYVLPTITSLLLNIRKVNIIYANALKDAVVEGIHTRFDYLFEVKTFILAAICHPKFKMS